MSYIGKITGNNIKNDSLPIQKNKSNKIIFTLVSSVLTELYNDGSMSITRTGTGKFDFVFATAKANTNYVIKTFFNLYTVGDAVIEINAKATTGFTLWLSRYGVGFVDPVSPNNCFVEIIEI